ncbi:MAG: hypothetical protein SCM11_11150, partial [Bacillota bacterium]|nr:hypothetical protein [Bacillota bacterium]
RPTITARRRPVLASSQISAPLMQLGRMLIPLYLHFVLRFRKIEIVDPKRIIESIRDFQMQKTRLIVAFRHPYGDEPQLIFHAIHNLLPRLAKRYDMTFSKRPHLRMVHDYAVALWGDPLIRFVLPRVGAVPVYHVTFDPASLKRIRSILLDDPNPLGLAPEGQISYHSETLPRIEQGTIRMGFWCARDLEKAGRSESVQILPVSIHYQYDRRDLKKVQAAIARLEKRCGLSPSPVCSRNDAQSVREAELQSTIERIEDRLLDIAETFYGIACQTQPHQDGSSESNCKDKRRQRWDALLMAALDKGEQILGLTLSSKDVIARVYRIRHEGWKRIYPEKLPEGISSLELALMNRQAGEAWHAMRHMEFVDLMSYHDTGYLRSRPLCGSSFDRIVETVINLEDLDTRLRGGNITNRPNVIRKRAVLIPAPCLDLTDHLAEYHEDAKKTVRDMTEELRMSLLSCMEEYCDGT